MKVAVIIAEGFEEGEALTIVDILRRGQVECYTVGLNKIVEGGHGIVLQCDHLIDQSLLDYDMVVLPGGYGGVQAMLESEKLLSLLKEMNEQGKYIGAMCAAPVVLEKANLLENKRFTAYQGYENKIKQGIFLEDKVVIDGNLITSRGPATCYSFAYKLLEILGGDALAVKKRMVYFNAFDVKEDE